MNILTSKQRRFATAVALGTTPIDAAGVAGYHPDRRNDWARRNMDNALVRAMIALLQEAHPVADADASGIGDSAEGSVTREDVVRMLSADRRLAYRKGTPSAAVSASLAIARLNGLIVERRQVEAKPLAEMSDEELAQHLAALEREARAVLAIDLTAEEVRPAAGDPAD